MSGGHRPLEISEICNRLNDRIEMVVKEFLPGAVKTGDYYQLGDIRGAVSRHGPGCGSTMIGLRGTGRGLWTDFSSGEHGDALDIAMINGFGGDKGRAVAWAKSKLGLDDMDPARIERERAVQIEQDRSAQEAADREIEAKKRGARALWMNGKPLDGSCPASRYLAGRGIDVGALGKWPGSLRYHGEVWNRDAGVKLPCMVAMMVTPDGVHVAAHRTWLGRDAQGQWVKADGADLGVPRGSAKKVLGKSGGAFIPLRKGAANVSMGDLRRPETIFVTEGIEDGLTIAMAKPDVRVVAGYSLRNLGMIAFPQLIETIVIVADRDEGAREIEALERAIGRQQARGHHVRIVMPPPGVKDFNAWLVGRHGQVAA